MLVSMVVRQIGLGPRRTGMLSSAVTWLYVGFLGFPDAATRAALILTFVSVSRWRTRPPGALGAVATSLLVLFLVDPLSPARPGFQLSFAGALGLLIVAPPIRRRLDAAWLCRIPRPFKGGRAAGVGALLRDLPTSLEVLKVGHHGSITSTSDGLLLHTTPALAVISVGANNRYGHPDDRVVARLRTVGSRIFRTDRNGHVRVRARRSGLHEVVGAS